MHASSPCATDHGKLHPMRVLHIGKFWPPYAGGIERLAWDICSGLARDGVQVDVLAHAEPGCWRSSEHPDHGIRVHLAACLGQLAYAPVSPTFGVLLRRVIARHQPQLLHMHLPNPSAFWALALPAARRLPWVLHWHSDIAGVQTPASVRTLYRLYRPFETAQLRQAARIICTSPEYRERSATLRPWLDKTCVIAPGSPPLPAVSEAARRAAAARWPGQGLRLLALGRLSHFKGFDVLLRALTQVSGVQLLLVGDGECAPALRAQVSELGLGGRVRLAGTLVGAERDAVYQAAEAFCLPSTARSESFGLVLLEAMSVGLPILASAIDGAGVLHVLDHGRAGRLVPPGDPKALADALSEWVLQPHARRELGEAGYRRWQQHFTQEESASRIKALYADLLG